MVVSWLNKQEETNAMPRKNFKILAQPNDTTCGPTCLHAIYNFYGEDVTLKKIIHETESLHDGGTLAVMLGLHALSKGYDAKIYTYNLLVFDPTWFDRPELIPAKLRTQRKVKTSKKLALASSAYEDFLKQGGEILFQDLTRTLIRKYLSQGTPILTGLSSTYLYRSMRETEDCIENDIEGVPTGHFVVLHSYNRKTREVAIADPFPNNPVTGKTNYVVHIDRVIGAILLGIVTYDANLLVIEPREK